MAKPKANGKPNLDDFRPHFRGRRSRLLDPAYRAILEGMAREAPLAREGLGYPPDEPFEQTRMRDTFNQRCEAVGLRPIGDVKAHNFKRQLQIIMPEVAEALWPSKTS